MLLLGLITSLMSWDVPFGFLSILKTIIPSPLSRSKAQQPGGEAGADGYGALGTDLLATETGDAFFLVDLEPGLGHGSFRNDLHGTGGA